MSTQTIYDALVGSGMTIEGACALMGNMQQESRMKSNIVQIGCSKLTDEQYTAAADNGLIDFVHDSIGYGLCQWTHWERKQRMLDFAKKLGTSIGDEDMQVKFAIWEMKNYYNSTFSLLCSSHDLFYCTQFVCVNYEQPKYNNVNIRYIYAQGFLQMAYAEKPSGDNRIDKTILVIQSIMAGDGYWDVEQINGVRNDLFRKKIVEWANDVASI